MALHMSRDFLTRTFSSVYVIAPTVGTLVGVVTTYGSRLFEDPAIKAKSAEIGEFAFHDGLLLPHQKYLYGSSDTGEPFIVGKKLAGEDYSAWEAGYAKFARLKSVTYADSTSKSTWSWSFEEPKASPSLNICQLLLWLLFGIVCLLLLCYAVRNVVSRLSRKKHENGDAKPSKLTLLWRNTFVRMYREQKSEIMSLFKLAVHYYNSGKNLKAERDDKLAEQQKEIESLRHMVDTQTARAQNLEKSNHELAAEHATASETVEDLQRRLDTQTARAQDLMSTNRTIEDMNTTANETIEDLRQRLTTQSTRAQDLEDTNRRMEGENTTANETIEDLRQRLNTESTRAQDLESTNRRMEGEGTTANAKVKDLEEQIRALKSDKEAANAAAEALREQVEALQSEKGDDAKEPSGEEPPESVVTPEGVVAVVDTPTGISEGEHSMAEAGPENDVKKDTTKQDDDSPALDNEPAGQKLGKNGKPLIQRANRRADGSIRTPSHPDYVPLEEAPSRLGDRPFHGQGRGMGGNKGRGGGGGRNGGGNFGGRGGRGDGGRFGW